MLDLQAAAAAARQIGIPQCIAVVDRGGHLLAFLRMDGAKVLSQDSATQKAATAASSAAPSGEVADCRFCWRAIWWALSASAPAPPSRI